MKNSIFSLGAVFLMTTTYVCGCGVCKANVEEKVVKQSSLISMSSSETIMLKISGMSCSGCASHIHKELSKTPGVISDEIKYPGDMALIKYDASKISIEEIIKVIEKAGYKAEIKKERKGKSSDA